MSSVVYKVGQIKEGRYDEYYTHIKIGVSSEEQMLNRLAQLQSGNPFSLRFIQVISVPNDALARVLESYLHRRYEKYRARGEWFRCEGCVDREKYRLKDYGELILECHPSFKEVALKIGKKTIQG